MPKKAIPDINKDTPLVPYLIAERAAWNVLEEKHKELTPTQCAVIVQDVSPELIKRAERHYSQNDFWRKQLHRSKDMRYYLEMFMEHWAYEPIAKEVRKLKLLNTTI